MSFSGSARQIWQLTEVSDAMWARVALGLLAAIAIALTWVGVAITYVAWGLFVWPVQRLGARRQAVEDRGPHSVKHANIVT